MIATLSCSGSDDDFANTTDYVADDDGDTEGSGDGDASGSSTRDPNVCTLPGPRRLNRAVYQVASCAIGGTSSQSDNKRSLPVGASKKGLFNHHLRACGGAPDDD